MKKSLIALAALTAFAGAAQAQSSVEIYGLLDAGVGTINNVHTGATTTTNLTNASWTGMTTGNEATSRLGFRGNEDLGGGLKANFVLEAQILPTTGEVGSTSVNGVTVGTTSSGYSGSSSGSTSVYGNAFFDRQATVGLSGGFGKVDLGRMNNIAYDKLVEFDPRAYGNFAGMGSLGVNKLSRENSAVKYYSPVVNGFQVGALYGFGGVAGSTSSGQTIEASVGYTSGSLKLIGTYSQLNTLCAGPVGATTSATTGADANGNTYPSGYCAYFGSSTSGASVAAGATSLKQATLAAQYSVGDLTGILGYLDRSNGVATSSKH